MSKEIIIIQQEEWYLALLEECRAIITEAVFTSRWALVEGYWNLGKRIREDCPRHEKGEHYQGKLEELLSDLTVSLGKSEATLWRAVAAYDKYPELDQIPEGKNISWNKLITLYLPEPKKEKNIPLPEGKYNIIYADPPWRFWEGGEKNQSQHYQTMEFEDIAKLPIQDIAADNCILFLWATRVILPEAIELINRWGFKYSTIGFVWIKSKQDKTGFAFGNGNWTRANAEYCLIGIKGSIERKDASVSEIIYEPREEHSKKPAIVRDKIIQLVGDLSRIELFVRGELPKGWQGWGQEYDK